MGSGWGWVRALFALVSCLSFTIPATPLATVVWAAPAAGKPGTYHYRGNHHEHFASLMPSGLFLSATREPRPTDAFRASRVPILYDLSIDDTFLSKEQVRDFVRKAYSADELSEGALSRMMSRFRFGAGTTVGDLVSALRTAMPRISPERHATRLLEVPGEFYRQVDAAVRQTPNRPHRDAIVQYLVAERLRNKLLDRVTAGQFREMAREYFASAPAEDRSVIKISAKETFFAPKSDGNVSLAEVLMQEARRASPPSQVEPFWSITRDALVNGEVVIPERMRAAFERGVVRGIDVSSSIFEWMGGDKVSPETYGKVLLEVMRFASERNLPLRIHAFEGTDQGPFYEGLRTAMREFRTGRERPLHLIVGHSHALARGARMEGGTPRVTPRTNDWLRELAAFNTGNRRVSFDVNGTSNRFLQGADYDALAAFSRAALRAGFDVNRGHDGHGILRQPTPPELLPARIDPPDVESCPAAWRMARRG